MCIGETRVHIGFGTICCFRHLLGILEHIPANKGGLLYATSLNSFKILQQLPTMHKPTSKLFSMAPMALYIWSQNLFIYCLTSVFLHIFPWYSFLPSSLLQPANSHTSFQDELKGKDILIWWLRAWALVCLNLGVNLALFLAASQLYHLPAPGLGTNYSAFLSLSVLCKGESFYRALWGTNEITSLKCSVQCL